MNNNFRINTTTRVEESKIIKDETQGWKFWKILEV
jgi:hypothetical protein